MAIERNPIRRKPDWAEDSKPLPNLPQEIIVEILSRLSVKSLLRFTCACKSWRSLISHPKFAKTHLSVASLNTDYTHDRLLLRNKGYYHPDLNSCSISAIMYEQSATAVSLDCPFVGSPDSISIVGSCNGLVCITIHKSTIILWNPSTRKAKKLPEIGMQLNELTDSEHAFSPMWLHVYGFGYDESIDDYKVVVVFHVRFKYMQSQNRVAVYTSRTDSWRRIGDCPHCLDRTCLGKFASGALHWIPIVRSKDIIVSLDLARETFGEVSQPDYVDSCRNLTMDVVGGCLYTLYNSNRLGVELWVMKEYGIRESWTKLVAIHDKTHSLYGQLFKPLFILKNGDILMAVRGHLVQYNPKDGSFFYRTVDKCFLSFRAYPYIGSLVSPDTDADNRV
ncbi:F-box/kelch-repeat protein At3g23880-like [Rhododendron vialii]|uniref:F-box/kelch-repeat protein At3g23880-like n=1 Tax=Rhododendron vialii TaxID=182163 RepID=UPI00265FF280|nr:F-box/kelch-repeat protein At3g23880-like [Rhododendron vialii]